MSPPFWLHPNSPGYQSVCRKDSRKSNFHSLPRFSGGEKVGNQVEFGLESIIDIAMSDLCVYLYVSPKTDKTKLLLIHHCHPYSCP